MGRYEVEVTFAALPTTLVVEADSLKDAWERRAELISGADPAKVVPRAISVAALDEPCPECAPASQDTETEGEDR